MAVMTTQPLQPRDVRLGSPGTRPTGTVGERLRREVVDA
jgi:hypothetical protein